MKNKDFSPEKHTLRRNWLIFWSILAILLVVNLGAIIDAILHPEIPYFDPEHILVGLITALVVALILVILNVYIDRFEKALRDNRASLEALEASEARHQSLVETLPEGIIVQRQGRVLYANPAAANIAGAAHPADLTGRSPADLAAPEIRVRMQERIQQALQGTASPKEEGKFLRLDGKTVDVQVSVLPVSYDGQPASLAVIEDITARKQAEEQVRKLAGHWQTAYTIGKEINASLEIETVFQTLYHHLQGLLPCEDFVISLYDETTNTMGGNYIMENGVRVPAHTYSADHGLGGSIVHSGQPVLLNSAQEVAASGIRFEPYGSGPQTVSVLAVPLLLKDKALGILSAQSYHENAYTRDDLELMEMIAGRVADAIENARLFRQVQDYHQHLEQLVEERTNQLHAARQQLVRDEKLAVLGQLAGSVGHELRNPLGVINTSIYYLKMVQPDVNEKIKEYHDRIEQQVHLSDKIISDLLEFARGVNADRKPVAVSELVETTLKRFPASAAVQVNLDLPADLPQVFADPRQMEEILGNLVTNACQAMPEGGKLSVISERFSVDGGAWVRIAVKDTGTGITPENMQKLFEPLFTTKLKGIGLGLTVCKKLAEANGGRIEVESQVGQGSTFTLILPVFQPKEQSVVISNQ
jgi:PAS domain S-box-containing protein